MFQLRKNLLVFNVVIDLHLYSKCHSSPQVFFTHFASKNLLPGFSIIWTLAGNGLMINFSDIEKNRKNFSLSKMMFLEQNFGYLLSRLYAKTNCPWNFYRSLRTTKVLKFFFCEIWCAELILRLTVCEGKVVLWARKKLMSKSLKLYSLLLLLEKKTQPLHV